MIDVALLIAAGAFAVLVLFTVPVLLQLRDAAKELEFTLREAREAIRRIRELSEKAEAVVDRGRTVVDGASKALMAVDGILGKAGRGMVSRVLTTAIEFFPVAMAGLKLFNRYKGRGRDER